MFRSASLAFLTCSGFLAAYAQQPATNVKPAGGDLTDPTEILKKADEATKALDFVKYTASGKGTGGNETRFPSLEGTVVLKGFKNGRPEKWRYELKARRAGSEEVNEFIAGSDGNEFYLIDPSKKTAYVDIDPAVLGSAGAFVRGVTMMEYVHETPFSDEINSEKKDLKGVTKVGGEDCYEVDVKYATANLEATWFFSKKDFLPRRVDRKGKTPSGEPAGSQLIVTSLTPDPKFDKDPFKFELPAGYTKSEDFAP